MKFLTRTLVQATTEVTIPTHRIVVVDVSGSMSGELPKLRKQLKNKITSMILPEDTLSIVWFSSKGQCGALFENVQVSTVTDLSKIHTAIDRFLVPTGLTGFKDPLEKVVKLIADASDRPAAMTFMTDGGENQSSRSEVMKACAKAAEVVTSTTFVEYGYYADHNMIMEMAEEMGGAVVQSENYEDYVETLDQILKGRSVGKRTVIDDIIAEFVVGITADSIVIAKPINGTVTLPASVSAVVWQGTGSGSDTIADQAACALVAALIQRGSANEAVDVAAKIGDVTLFKSIENAFSKQDYAKAAQLATEFATGKRKLFSDKPKQTNLTVDPDAYNVLTLLMDLAEQEGNFLNISHPEFKYVSIGRSSETVADENGFVPKFTDKAGDVKGSISALKFDEDRPNISILVRREGTVSLPKNDYGFGESVESFIWRNYAIVADGIVNVKKLPVVLTKASHDLLTQLGVVTEAFKVNQTYVIDLSAMPVINRSMVSGISAKEMFTKNFELYKLKCEQKVLGSSYEKPEVSDDFAAKYGQEGAEFLKKYGVTPGGFGPKKVAGETTDPRIAKVLEIKLAGLSSVPKIDDVKKSIADGKSLTPSAQCVKMALEKHAKVSDAKVAHKEIVAQTRALREEIVRAKFGIILGKKWFTDMQAIEENTMEMDFGLGKLIKCQALLSDKEI